MFNRDLRARQITNLSLQQLLLFVFYFVSCFFWKNFLKTHKSEIHIPEKVYHHLLLSFNIGIFAGICGYAMVLVTIIGVDIQSLGFIRLYFVLGYVFAVISGYIHYLTIKLIVTKLPQIKV